MSAYYMSYNAPRVREAATPTSTLFQAPFHDIPAPLTGINVPLGPTVRVIVAVVISKGLVCEISGVVSVVEAEAGLLMLNMGVVLLTLEMTVLLVLEAMALLVLEMMVLLALKLARRLVLEPMVTRLLVLLMEGIEAESETVKVVCATVSGVEVGA
jgi:hypothetical protein